MKHFSAKSLTIHRVLDESCLYDLLNPEKLPEIARIHWMMTRGHFFAASHFCQFYRDLYLNSAEYTADMALFYWKEHKFEVTFNATLLVSVLLAQRNLLEDPMHRCSLHQYDLCSISLTFLRNPGEMMVSSRTCYSNTSVDIRQILLRLDHLISHERENCMRSKQR